ncbi:hypothetical protein OF83DRAFT_1147277 [Amylostereum chailletii]|nr:hypothetical protein OF83DRAFT_1147277 [Amylostereum chailletii]
MKWQQTHLSPQLPHPADDTLPHTHTQTSLVVDASSVNGHFIMAPQPTKAPTTWKGLMMVDKLSPARVLPSEKTELSLKQDIRVWHTTHSSGTVATTNFGGSAKARGTVIEQDNLLSGRTRFNSKKAIKILEDLGNLPSSMTLNTDETLYRNPIKVEVLINEQGVAEKYRIEVLEKAWSCVTYLLDNHKGCKSASQTMLVGKFIFSLRPQLIMSSVEGITRGDHHFAVESVRDLTTVDHCPPAKRDWMSANTFSLQWGRYQDWMKAVDITEDMDADAIKAARRGKPKVNMDEPKSLPFAVTGIVEEKRPGTLDERAWVQGYGHVDTRSTSKSLHPDRPRTQIPPAAYENVVKIVPQLLQYTWDAGCPYIILTDYCSLRELGIQWHL